MSGLASRIGAAILLQGLIISIVPLARSQDRQPSATGPTAPIMERYPERLQARIELRQRALSTIRPPAGGFSPRSIINLTKHWRVGQTVTVAFRGGDTRLHRDIATAVTEWTQFANLTFDFGINPATGSYRSWSKSDTNFTADIRVSFDQTGYYSHVGNDSINRDVARPGEESLNLEGFDQQLPDDWKAVALHEFGHAIGFEHEHQSPIAPCDFRYNDDPGYVQTRDSFGQFIKDPQGRRPGLYTFLGGPPNNWPRAVVDFNLNQLPDSRAYDVGPFDKDSIMKYFFPDWMFVAGTNSACYTGAENLVLSDGDKQGAAKVYPRAPEGIASASTKRTQALEAAAKIPGLPATAQQHFQEELNKIKIK